MRCRKQAHHMGLRGGVVLLLAGVAGLCGAEELCRARQSALRSLVTNQTHEEVMTVTNNAAEDVNIFWVDTNFQEHNMHVMGSDIGNTIYISARWGRAFRAVTVHSHRVLDEWIIGVMPPQIQLRSCVARGPMEAPFRFDAGGRTLGVEVNVVVGFPVGPGLPKKRIDNKDTVLNCTLSELALGVNVSMLWNRTAPCPVCHGYGAEPGFLSLCGACNGTGGHSRHHELGECTDLSEEHSHDDGLCACEGDSGEGGDSGDGDSGSGSSRGSGSSSGDSDGGDSAPGQCACDARHQEAYRERSLRCMSRALPQHVHVNCPVCCGFGVIPEQRCPHCGGLRYITETVERVVYIPPGADNNYMVTFVQLSDAAPHAVAGDFRFVVNALESPSFVRTGADLEFKLNLSLKEALLGWSREIIHPNGSRIVVNMTDITVPEKPIRVRTGGMPKLRFVAETEPVEDVSELFGDLIIIPSVTFLSGGSRNVTEVDRRVSSEEVVAALDP